MITELIWSHIMQYEKTALKSAVVFARLKNIWELEESVITWEINGKTINKKILATMESFLDIIKVVLWEKNNIWRKLIQEVAFDVWNSLIKSWNRELWLQINNIALQVQVICLSHEVKKSYNDHLTWLYNRRFIESYLLDAIEDNRINWTNYWVILVDVDHFKNINDTFWHNIWDMVLVELWNIFKENFRWDDKIGRWWWEEFIIIIKPKPKTDNSNCEIKDIYIKRCLEIKEIIEKELAKRIRIMQNLTKKCEYDYNCKNCSEKKCSTIMANKDITVSIWVTYLTTTDTLKSVIGRADSWLYLAKEWWRNRVEFSEYEII